MLSAAIAAHGPGTARTSMARAGCGLHDAIPGVADQWRTSIRDESHGLAGIECGENLRDTLRLVVLVRGKRALGIPAACRSWP